MSAKILADADDGELASQWSDLTDGERAEAQEAMEYLGVSARRAKAILKAYGGGKYLRRGIAGAVAWNFEISSLEEAQRALVWCRKMYSGKDTTLTGRDRVEVVKAVGVILGNIARLCDSSIAAAEKFERGEKLESKPPEKAVMVGVSISNYPPVAALPARANSGTEDGSGSDNGRDRPL